MGTYHTVAPGEHLSGIAHAHGFASYKTIWEAAENQKLKEERKNPNILLVGDRVFIPEKETKEESRPTDKKHRFEFQPETLKLRIGLMDLKNKPIEGHLCSLTVEGKSIDLTTKGDGTVEDFIPNLAAVGKLVDHGKPGEEPHIEREIPLKIGHLDPEDTVSGQIARLNNLGYNAGVVPDHALTDNEAETLRKSPQFLSAVEEFQCDFGLKVDGICGKNTRDKLVKVHGC